MGILPLSSNHAVQQRWLGTNWPVKIIWSKRNKCMYPSQSARGILSVHISSQGLAQCEHLFSVCSQLQRITVKLPIMDTQGTKKMSHVRRCLSEVFHCTSNSVGTAWLQHSLFHYDIPSYDCVILYEYNVGKYIMRLIIVTVTFFFAYRYHFRTDVWKDHPWNMERCPEI